MAHGGIDCSHARIEIPGHVFRCKRAAFNVDDVIGEGNGGWIQQAGINLQQRFAALEGVINPLGAGV